MPDASHQTISKTGTQPYPLADRLPKVIPSPQTSQNTPVDKALPFRENDPAPLTRTQALVPPTGNHRKALVPPYPLEHIPPIRGTMTCRKEAPNSKSNKMKRQRNMPQMKEHTKNPLDKMNDEETGNQPEKEFRVLIIKMIQNLGNKMKAQIN